MSFWQAKTKLRPTDLQFSKYIRLRDGKCVFGIKCNQRPEGETQEEYIKRLTNSHLEGRRKESVRFDEENCDTACRKCHQYLEEHKNEYREWKHKQLGEQRYNLLVIRANTPGKRDDEMQKIINKKLLEAVEI